MKLSTTSAILFLLAASFSAADALTLAGNNPISRVVKLLKGLVKKLEQDMDMEKDAYETYMCWGKKLIAEKNDATIKAQSRVNELTNYVANIDSGAIDFTQEKEQLTQELKEVTEEIAGATSRRKTEHEEFLAAQTEIMQAIQALQAAIQVLAQATKSSTGLITIKSTVNEAFHERLADAASLERAVEVGKKYLSEGNARFLEDLITGQVPVVPAEYKEATFKMKYKLRSRGIQDTLAELLETFKGNLAEAQEKEEEAIKSYNAVLSSKTKVKENTEKALNEMAIEIGAKKSAEAEAKDEKAFLNNQIQVDAGIVQQTETAMGNKKQEYDTRLGLRQGEIAAMNKAISILHSDDARDLFTKSFASQGYGLLQIKQQGARFADQTGAAAAALRTAERMSGDTRLSAIAARIDLCMGGKDFSAVLQAIDTMLTNLKAEETADLEKKEQCEKDHADNSASMAEKSRDMDGLSEAVRRNKEKIADAQKKIDEKNAEIEEIEADKKKAKENRDAEHAEWLVNDQDDTAAANLVTQARDVIKNFYKDNIGTGLLQIHNEATAPPKTWDGSYKGTGLESDGVVTILEVVHEDILRDQADAKADDIKAKAEYDKYVEEQDKAILTLETARNKLIEVKSAKETEIEGWNDQRRDKKDAIAQLQKTISDAAPACDFALINFDIRRENRHLEMDGLNKAKTILASAHTAPERL